MTAERLKGAGVDEVALEAVSRAAQAIRDGLLADWLSPGHRERLDARARAESADDRVASSRLDRFALTDSPFDPTGWTAYESAILSLESSLDETRRDLFTLGRRLAGIRYPCPSTYDDVRGGLPALDIDLLSRGTARAVAGTIRRLQARTGLLRTVNPWLSPDETYRSAYELVEAIRDSLEATARPECPEADTHTGAVGDRSSGPYGTTCGPTNPPPTDGAASGAGPPHVSAVGAQSVAGDTYNVTPPSCSTPDGLWWDKEERSLYDGGRLLRTYGKQARNVIAVLDRFEAKRSETGTWPSSVRLEQFTDR